MSPGWHGLVQGNYEAVMPVTWRSKLGISYLCQPAFTQQLGVFSAPHANNADVMERFLMAIAKRFPLVEIFLNYENATQQAHSAHVNFVLDLNAPYVQIASRYKTDLVKNLARTKKFDLQYVRGDQVDEALSLYRQTYADRMRIRPQDYLAFAQLCTTLAAQQQAFVRKVQLPSGELLAIGLFLTDGRRIYNIASTTLPNGRTLEANHVLFDQLIHEFAGQPLLQWVINGAKASRKLHEVLVATDDARICDLAVSCGVRAIMTDSALPTGTDRIWQAAREVDGDVILNIQGDEPLIDGALLDQRKIDLSCLSHRLPVAPEGCQEFGCTQPRVASKR
jgi:hypothetical protein